MVRKDLAEFGCTMQQDTGRVVGVTSTTLKESLKVMNQQKYFICAFFFYILLIIMLCVIILLIA